MYSSLNDLGIEEMKRGWRREGDALICALCGEVFRAGEVYPIDGRYFDAENAMARHIEAHGGAFEALLALDRKETGLTGNQAQLMRLMHQGMSDAEIARALGLAASTVRHQRFVFREKARQARAYLALFELSVGRTPPQDAPIRVHPAATMVDERYQMTLAEEEKLARASFSSFEPLRLASFPLKQKRKLAVLRRLVTLFEPDAVYTEMQVNAILKEVYPDCATLRRYLIEYGFMERNADGSQYRLTPAARG